MDGESEKLEVLMATYNGASYIREQIESILAQTYEQWHLTISDDGSDDGTDIMIDDYAQKYPDKIRRVYSGRRFSNAKEHFMWLIQQCNADWIALSDQDDFIFASKFAKMAAEMRKAEGISGAGVPILIFSDQTPTDANLTPICDSLMKMQNQYTDEIDWQALIFQNVVTGGACMFNQALARLACQCKAASQMIMHDWWLAIVAAKFGKVIYLNESTGYYRQHGSNCTGAKAYGSLLDISKRLSNIALLKEGIQCKKIQAERFKMDYQEQLDKQDIQFLEQFSRRKSGVSFYIKHRKQIHGLLRQSGFWVFG